MGKMTTQMNRIWIQRHTKYGMDEGKSRRRVGILDRLRQERSKRRYCVHSDSFWNARNSSLLYNVDQWGDGYYKVGETGQVLIQPNKDVSVYELKYIVEKCIDNGATLPLLLRFPDILKDRIERQHQCFAEACQKYNFKGSYLCAFPIKANHSEDTIKSVINMTEKYKCGLEVGSKPELLVALGISKCSKNIPIVCNGFKDEPYVELALLATKLGANVIISVDRFEELSLIIEGCKTLQIKPKIGLRVKLNTKHDGHWGNTSGYDSKFGLRIRELLNAVSALQESKLLESLVMLHFHLGSQVGKIAIIKSAMREVCSIYSEIRRLGAPLEIIDVGGGLAITYDGNKGTSRPTYTIQNYANDVIAAVNDMCVQKGIPGPTIITESGRSLASHHSLLVFNAQCSAHQEDRGFETKFHVRADSPMTYFFKTFEEVSNDLQYRNIEETYNDALQFKAEAENAFTLGLMTIEEVAYAELLFDSIMQKVLKLQSNDDNALEARPKVARPCFANLSIFSSAIDVWGIDQPFPVMPINGLSKRPNEMIKLYDLTCDSDGEIKRFVTTEGHLSATLPIATKESEELLLAIFLIGAYQESMGCYHNLFGQTCTATIMFTPGLSEDIQILKIQNSETSADILQHNKIDVSSMYSELSNALDSDANEEIHHSKDIKDFLCAYNRMLNESSYLKISN